MQKIPDFFPVLGAFLLSQKCEFYFTYGKIKAIYIRLADKSHLDSNTI